MKNLKDIFGEIKECGGPGQPPCPENSWLSKYTPSSEKVSKKDEKAVLDYIQNMNNTDLQKVTKKTPAVPNYEKVSKEEIKRLSKAAQREKLRKEKRKNHLYELNNNPNKLDGESDEVYNTRQKMFEYKRQESLNPQSKLWEGLKNKQAELPYTVRAVSEVLTSPFDIAYYLKENVLNTDGTRQFKSDTRLYDEGIDAIDSVTDAATLIAPWKTGIKAPTLLNQAIVKTGREVIQENVFDALKNQKGLGGKVSWLDKYN
jgi:hypothetical protein